MGHSIEFSNTFNIAKRILKQVAPDFTVAAAGNLKKDCSILDIKNKMILVPEHFAYKAAATIIFYAGILRLDESKYPYVLGKGNFNIPEEELLNRLAVEHSKADEEACEWAKSQMELFYPEIQDNFMSSVLSIQWSYEDWYKYFNNKESEGVFK